MTPTEGMIAWTAFFVGATVGVTGMGLWIYLTIKR